MRNPVASDGQGFQIDLFVLDGAPQPLDKNVVQRPATSKMIRIALSVKRFVDSENGDANIFRGS